MKQITCLLFVCASLQWLAACSTSQKSPAKQSAPIQANDQLAKEFHQAEHYYRIGKFKSALRRFQQFATRHPNTDLTGDAFYYVGLIYYQNRNYVKADQFFNLVVNSRYVSHTYDEALVGSALAKTQLGQIDDALNVLSRFQITEKTSPEVAYEALDLSSKLKLRRNDAVGAIRDLLKAGTVRQRADDSTAALSKATDLVRDNLTQAQLQELLRDSNLISLKPVAELRLGEILFDQKEWSGASSTFQDVVSQFPETEEAKQAQQFLETIASQQRTDANTIGIVLPLTGKYGQQGYKVLRGIEMAAGIFRKGSPSPFKLAIIDSEGNPDIARRGVETLVRDDHVVGIIGDLLSKTAQAVSSETQELGVPNITLSQKQGLTDIGNFVFRNTTTPDSQMRKLVEYAMRARNFRRFAVLFPNDSYGTEYATAFWDYVLLNGGEVTAAQTYAPDETDFRSVIQRLIGTYYDEDRAREAQVRLAEWKHEQIKKGLHDKPPKDTLPPVVDFDAIFIADSPKAVGQIAPMLAYNDVDKVPLLGTSLWDSSQLTLRGSKYVEGCLFMDDFFPQDDSAPMKRFMTEFQSQFAYVPDFFEALGYDSAALMTQIIAAADYSLSRQELRDRLARAQNIAGAITKMSISPTRDVEKTLIPLTVKQGQIVKSSPGDASL